MDSRIVHCIIAGDCPDARRLVRDAIVSHRPHARISEASDHEAAKRIFQIAGADLMIIAQQMSHSFGAELVRALRLDKAYIPIVLVCDPSFDRREALAAGVTHVIEKEKLAESIAYYLPVWLPQR